MSGEFDAECSPGRTGYRITYLSMPREGEAGRRQRRTWHNSSGGVNWQKREEKINGRTEKADGFILGKQLSQRICE